MLSIISLTVCGGGYLASLHMPRVARQELGQNWWTGQCAVMHLFNLQRKISKVQRPKVKVTSTDYSSLSGVELIIFISSIMAVQNQPNHCDPINWFTLHVLLATFTTSEVHIHCSSSPSLFTNFCVFAAFVDLVHGFELRPLF